MYVETDFLLALVKDDDWLTDQALQAIETHSDIQTSILAYAELLVLLYNREQADYDIDVPGVITNLLELVPTMSEEHQDAVLAGAAFIDEYGLTPFDALHAGLATITNEPVLSSDQAYDTVGLDRHPLESFPSE